jgi:hypothetical protein
MFDILDVRSIMYCWKALIFDKSVSGVVRSHLFIVGHCEQPVLSAVLCGRGVEAADVPIDMVAGIDYPRE